VVWAIFASCVLAIPLVTWRGERTTALLLIGVVCVEVLILAFNRFRCPLTDVAARYTTDRRDNFDIYLPEWLARYNKLIFGTLFVAGVLMTVVR
jgi:hypothetical protein